MCGFAGFYNPLKRPLLFTREQQEALHQKIAHRGPDDSGIYLDENELFCFVHRRLSIVDLSPAAAQPMWNQQRSKIIIYNGEIYNHQALKKELEFEGIVFHSNSDTETLLHILDRWGIEGLHRINGMFSFVYFDYQTKKVYLVKDRFGMKPLYFNKTNEIWSFTSEMKAFDQLPWINKEISRSAMDHYLTFMVTPAPMTLYKNSYKLPAGYLVEIDQFGNGKTMQWYTPLVAFQKHSAADYPCENSAIENVSFLLKQSIKEHMHADVPVGAFLSGGIDSSLNVALMAQTSSKIKTFTVAMENNAESELPWAKKVADLFDTDHHELILSDHDAENMYEKMVYQTDEPLADCVNLPFYFVAQEARRQGISVVQVGEAADELFFGYPLYADYAKLLSLNQMTSYLPSPLKHFGATLIKNALPLHSNFQTLSQLWAENKPLFLGGALAFNQTEKEYFFDQSINESDPLLEQLFPFFPYTHKSVDLIEYHLNRLFAIVPDADIPQQIMFLELSQRLPELLLMRADKMSMLASVEARVPFLDHRLVEYMIAMPQNIKAPHFQLKYILKKVARGIIPDEIIDRKKVGFAAPVKTWMAPHSSFLQKLEKNIEKHPLQKALYKKYQTMPFATNDYLHAVQKWTLHNLLTTLQFK